ncbi:MAG TPA: lytic transglycosylase domain-containing protein [Terriglobia bacterium]|nr:lytic transglycosylase domain-containing protein [Terriglobia bacterium]
MKRVSKALIVLVWLATGTQAAQAITVKEYSARFAEYYARVYKVPVDLVDAVIEVESNWQPYAVSPKGAAGLMQLMPATAVRFGVRNRFRIEENIQAGTAYLAWLMDLFRGDLRLAVAAYFAGEASVLSRGGKYSSPEVYRYVSRVARLYRAKRLARMSTLSGVDTCERSRGGK